MTGVLRRLSILIAVAVAGSAAPAWGEEPTPAPAASPPAAAPPEHWLVPLLRATVEAARQQPQVLSADLERWRAGLAATQATAQFSPDLTLGVTDDENRFQSTSFISGTGIVKNRTTSANAALGQTFSTGTGVRLQGNGSQIQTDDRNSLVDQFYNNNVQLVVSQALLQGGSREANLAAWRNAQDLEANARENSAEQLEGRFAALAEDWINLAGLELEVGERREQLAVAQRNLDQSQQRSRLGAGREVDNITLRRDVATQDAGLAGANRQLAGTHERVAVNWPGLALPPRAQLGAAALPGTTTAVSYATTRAGHASLRLISTAARTLAAARNYALDRLDLNLTFGKNGTDPNSRTSVSKLSDPETYHWTAGLVYEHRFGADSERLELERVRLALEQSKLQGVSDQRAWENQRVTLRQALEDARARVGEQQRILDAYHEEVRLVRAQADAGTIPALDLVTVRQGALGAELAVIQARLDVLRADLRLRAQEDRLLELLP
jgi:outer membrane protein TolC